MRSFAARRRDRRHRELPAGELQLAAMVDMMINLLLFLLNLFGKSGGVQHTSEDLSFARSTATEAVNTAPAVVLDRRRVTVSGTEVGGWTRDGAAPTDDERARLDAALAAIDAGSDRRLSLQVDKGIAWTSVAPVLAAAGRAGFADVRFVVSSAPER